MCAWPASRVHGRHHEYMASVMRAWPASRGHGRHHRCIRMQGYMVEMARLHPGPWACGPRAGIGGGGDGAGASNPRLKPGVRAHVTGGGPCVTGTMACVTGAGPGSCLHGRHHGCMAGITGAWPASRGHGRHHEGMAGITCAWPASCVHGRHHWCRAGITGVWPASRVQGRGLVVRAWGCFTGAEPATPPPASGQTPVRCRKNEQGKHPVPGR